VTALILGKPPEKPSGPSHFSILPVVRNCETQSFADMAKMWAFMLNYVWMSTVCCILICDGQAVEMWRNAKRKFPVEFQYPGTHRQWRHAFSRACMLLHPRGVLEGLKIHLPRAFHAE
jgi:hypothetical protein